MRKSTRSVFIALSACGSALVFYREHLRLDIGSRDLALDPIDYDLRCVVSVLFAIMCGSFIYWSTTSAFGLIRQIREDLREGDEFARKVLEDAERIKDNALKE